MFKKLFKGGGSEQPDEATTIEDLIVLERYEEAVGRLKARLKRQPADLHAHLRLAEAYLGLGERSRAVDAYVYAAEEYAGDGFYDRAIALLSKAKRFAPGDQTLESHIEQYRLAKASEHSRALAVEGLREGRSGGGTAALVVERLWHHVAASHLARNLRPEGVKRLFSACELISFREGEALAERGSGEPRLYLILDGVVGARLPRPDGAAVGVRDFGPGDVIGESVLLEKGTWPADYRAVEPVRTLVLDRAGLEQTLVGNPDPRGFLSTLRAEHNDRQVAELVQRMEAGEDA